MIICVSFGVRRRSPQGCQAPGLASSRPFCDVLTSIHHRTEVDFGKCCALDLFVLAELCIASRNHSLFSGIGFDPYPVVLGSLIGYRSVRYFWVVTTTGATRARTKTNTTNEHSQENIHDAGFNRIYFRLWKACLVS